MCVWVQEVKLPTLHFPGPLLNCQPFGCNLTRLVLEAITNVVARVRTKDRNFGVQQVAQCCNSSSGAVLYGWIGSILSQDHTPAMKNRLRTSSILLYSNLTRTQEVPENCKPEALLAQEKCGVKGRRFESQWRNNSSSLGRRRNILRAISSFSNSHYNSVFVHVPIMSCGEFCMFHVLDVQVWTLL